MKSTKINLRNPHFVELYVRRQEQDPKPTFKDIPEFTTNEMAIEFALTIMAIAVVILTIIASLI